MITKIESWAFKGLKSFTIEPKNINLLIGANGTGKTNFTDLIEFLSLTCRFGLKESFNKHNGLDEVRTKLSAGGRPPALHCSITLGPEPYRGIEKAQYCFTLSASKELVVDKEELIATVYPRSVGRPKLSEKIKFDKNRPIQIHFKRKKIQLKSGVPILLERSRK